MTLHNSTHFWNGDTLVLHLFLQPRASQNEWVGQYNGRIRLCITQLLLTINPTGECVKFFSKSLKTAKTNVNVVRGQTSTTKTVEIHHPDSIDWKKILELLGG